MLNPSIFKAYDIRGVVDKDFNTKDFEDIIKSIITFFKKKLKNDSIKIAIGRDVRVSTPKLFRATKKACLDQGVIMIDLGLTSTPSFYYGCLNYGYDAGMMITASHNPKEYNGVKMVIRQDNRLIKIGKDSGMDEIKKICLEKKFNQSKRKGKIITNYNIIKDEVNDAFKILKNIPKRKFRIVTDTANGMAITFLDEFFKKYPAQVIRMNAKLDGTFPSHEANPLKFETLRDLQKRVVEEKADFGIAPDADGDRIFFIDEKGKIVQATIITSMITEDILKNFPNETIVADIRYLFNVKATVEKNKGRLAITKVGHAFITQKLTEVNGFFAGESSGHYFFRQTGFAESTISVLAYILKILSINPKKTFSQIVKKYYQFYESGEYNFELPKGITGKEIQEKIATDYPDADISWLDGVSISYSNWRFNIRSSNTEPLLRLNIESDQKNLTKKKLIELKKKILSFGAKSI